MDSNSSLYALLERSASQYPDATALVFGERKCSYKELLELSHKFSKALILKKIGAGDRVAICAPKSIEYVAIIFGILRTGAAYIPLDFYAPRERNQYILDHCEARALFAPQSLRGAYTNYAEDNLHDFILGTRTSDTVSSDEDLAYILYTSGSTGRPKGVMVSESAASAFVSWSIETFLPSQKDVFSSHAPFHFDLSVFDLFVSMSRGATLVLIDNETSKQPRLLAKLIAETKITIWYSTPAVLNMLAQFGKMNNYNYDSLRMVLFAGEVYPVARFRELRAHWPSVEYYNLYGPTETNVCTYYKLPSDPDHYPETFPIGKCCRHYSGAVKKTNEGQLELFISGSGLMKGYWGQENIAEKIFHSDSDGKRWYNTGDLVSLDDKGNYIFLGRADRMIKRNGFRIELAEIENALSKNIVVRECAVISNREEEGLMKIIAFVCCSSAEEESVIRMKEYCIKHLPVYMIPDTFIFLESLPLTSSNKTDLQQLKKFL